MERKPRQKLPFPTSIAMFRDININFKLHLLFFFLAMLLLMTRLTGKHLVYEKLRPRERYTLVSPLQI